MKRKGKYRFCLSSRLLFGTLQNTALMRVVCGFKILYRTKFEGHILQITRIFYGLNSVLMTVGNEKKYRRRIRWRWFYPRRNTQVSSDVIVFLANRNKICVEQKCLKEANRNV
jgi:hypothetical protein